MRYTLLNPVFPEWGLPALGSGTCKPLLELIKIIVFQKTAWPRKSEVTRVASFFGFICILLLDINNSSNSLKFMTVNLTKESSPTEKSWPVIPLFHIKLLYCILDSSLNRRYVLIIHKIHLYKNLGRWEIKTNNFSRMTDMKNHYTSYRLLLERNSG